MIHIKKTLLLFLILIFLLASCEYTAKVNSRESSKGYNSFCDSISDCKHDKLTIEISDTGDVYSLEILGLNNEECETKISFQSAGDESASHLVGKNAICRQQWSNLFEDVKEFESKRCRDYVNHMILNMVTEMNKKDGVCTLGNGGEQ